MRADHKDQRRERTRAVLEDWDETEQNTVGMGRLAGLAGLAVLAAKGNVVPGMADGAVDNPLKLEMARTAEYAAR